MFVQLLKSGKIYSQTLSGYVDVYTTAKDIYCGGNWKHVTALPERMGCHRFEVNGSVAWPVSTHTVYLAN